MAHLAALPELDRIADDATPERRADLLARVAGLFAAHAGDLSAEQAQVFDGVLCRLLPGANAAARMEVLRLIENIPHAAPGAMAKLVPDQEDIAVLAKQGGRDSIVAALAWRTGVASDLVEALIDSRRPDPALVLCKAAGWDWVNAKAVLGLRRTLQREIPPHDLDAAFVNFERLSLATAEKVVRFWQASARQTRR